MVVMACECQYIVPVKDDCRVESGGNEGKWIIRPVDL